MSVLGNIEAELIKALEKIDGTTVTMPGMTSTYTFSTITASVNLRDDVIGIVKDKIQGNVNYNIEEINEDNTVFELGANCYGNMVNYRIIAEPKNNGIGISKNLINEQMNLILEDVKYILYRYNTLNNTCFGVQYIRSEKQYTNSNDMINSGKIIITIKVQYGQHGAQPNKTYNNNFI